MRKTHTLAGNLMTAIAIGTFAFGLQSAKAQTTYGTIVGNVTDTNGALLPDATVDVVETETNETRETTTNAQGEYTLSTVAAGTYNVTVTKQGFGPLKTSNIHVTLNTEVRVDASLNPGSLTQSVTVSSEAAQLQADSADVHAEVSSQSLEELPQPTRTYEGVIGLMPGVAPPSASTGGTNNPMRSMEIQSNGTSASGTNVRIDGVSATNPWVQFNSTAVPSTDAIRTVNVVTASSGADEGMVNGAAVNVQIKSGTNAFHGSAYEYHIDNLLKARPYFLPAGNNLPKLIDNDLGGTIGGPLLRNRLFFFGSYEGDFLHQGNTNIVTVPTAAIRQGNMAGSSTPIYDPNSGNADGTGRTPFGGNVIPANRISPIANQLVALIPEPNLPGISNNYYVNTPVYYKLQKIDTKLDWTATRKLSMFARFSDYPYNETQATIFGPVLSGGNGAFQSGNIYATSVSATYVATPNFVVEGLFGLTHSYQTLSPPGTNTRYGLDVLGIPGTNLGALPEAGGLPQFNVNSYSGYGYSYPALVYNDPVFEYTANATWTKGRHTIRFGFDISQQHMNHIEIQPTQFTFTGGATSLNGGAAANQYNSFADFLLGLPNNDTNSVQTVPQVTLRTWQYAPYVSDQWQVSQKLTFAVGTGWEYYPVPTRSDRGIEYFDLDTNQYKICGEGSVPKSCGINVQKTLFSPRIGLAYRPMATTVVRAGYSLNPEQINMYRDGLYSYPIDLTGNYSATNSYSAVTTLAQGIPALTPPDISSGILPLPAGVTFTTDPKNFIRGYTQSYNLTVEQDFGKGWLAQVGYVGTHSVHQHTRYNINYGLPGKGAASQPFYNGTRATGITGAEVVIYPYESMVYNSLQSTLRHAFSSGYQLGVSYTWSRWRGTCCDENGDGEPEIPIPQYFQLNRALLPGDRTNNVQISGLAQLPFGANKSFLKHGIAAAVAGGWQLNAIVSFYSGTPFSVTADGTSLNAPGSQQRADQVKASVQILHGVGDNPYFDPTAFAPVNQPRFGTASFDSLRGPGFGNADLGLFRNFALREGITAQGRIEVLNATNTPHFSNPDGNIADGSFDTITSTSPGSRTTDERYIRLGFKLTF
ncbi:TonB-dependent receptor [Acidipila sp. EB88]|uniref:TonB-dependent receptor n=1 Tax=Acidipila sp. EB88 TaxID=2305226 RepID=UPI00131508E0|nr:TonB-dependent receptor [Acidipila sp. EB88]